MLSYESFKKRVLKEFLDYDIDFPELVYDIVDYFLLHSLPSS